MKHTLPGLQQMLLALGIICFLFTSTAYTQTELTNQGDNVFINNDEEVHVVGGGVTLENDGNFNNTGQLYVEGDWVNNNPANTGFTANQPGEVILNGQQNFPAVQRIRGAQPTTFNNLILANSNIKLMELNATVEDSLSIGNAELRTQGNVMQLASSNPDAVTYNAGFVSSGVGGRLRWNLQADTTYFFPVGDSTEQGEPFRFRPVELTPNQAEQYAVRFAHTSPQDIGVPTQQQFLDSTLCQINPNFFHFIEPEQGDGNADIDFIFDNQTDQPYTDTMSYWAQNENFWRPMAPSTIDRQAPANYNTIQQTAVSTSESWQSFASGIFALASVQPSRDFVSTPGPLTPDPANPVPDTVTVGEPVSFTARDRGNFLYDWEFGDGAVETGRTPQHTFQEPGTYTVSLSVTNRAAPDACSQVYAKEYLVVPSLAIYAPNAFTPNGQPPNNVFEVIYYNLENVNFQIFNRYGKIIHDVAVQQPPARWDGTYDGQAVPEGVYVYRISGQQTGTGQEIERTGTVTVLR